MRNRISHFTYAVFVTLLILVIESQNASAQSARVFSFVTKGKVYLRWTNENAATTTGYIISRVEEGGNGAQTFTTSKLTLVDDIRKRLGVKTEFYLSLFKLAAGAREIPTEAFEKIYRDKTSRNLFGAICVVNPDFASVLGEMFVDSTILNSKNYIYQVTALSGTQRTVLIEKHRVDAMNLSRVPVPTDVDAKSAANGITINWKKNEAAEQNGNAVTTNVYRSESLLGPYERINPLALLPVQFNASSSSTNSYSDELIESAKTYYYQLRAVNVVGMESEPSPSIEARAEKAIQGTLSASVKQIGRLVQLEWTLPKNAATSLYSITRIDDKTKQTRTSNHSHTRTSATQTFFDSDIQEGTSYSYTITCDDMPTLQSDTLHISVQDATPPSAPMQLVSTFKNNVVIIEWKNNVESDLLGYTVERSDDSSFSVSTQLNAKLLHEARCIDTIAATEQSVYYYRVIAVDKSFNQSNASAGLLVRLPDVSAPSVPLWEEVSVRDSIVLLRWTKNRDRDFSQYEIYRSDDGTTFTKIGTEKSNTFTHSIAKGGEAWYYIIAVDLTGNKSEKSQVRKVESEQVATLPAPEQLIAQEKDSEILLQWKLLTNKHCTGYVIYRESKGKRTRIAEVNATTNTYADSPRCMTCTHKYIVAPLDQLNHEATPSEIVFSPKE